MGHVREARWRYSYAVTELIGRNPRVLTTFRSVSLHHFSSHLASGGPPSSGLAVGLLTNRIGRMAQSLLRLALLPNKPNRR